VDRKELINFSESQIRIRVRIQEVFKGFFYIAKEGIFPQCGSYVWKETDRGLHENYNADVYLDKELSVKV